MAGILDVAACRLREWDSRFFGVRIAQVTANRSTADGLARIVRDADASAIDCVYFLADAADVETVRAAEQNGFALVDIRLALQREIGAGGDQGDGTAAAGAALLPESPRIRVAESADMAALETLARTSHRNTRFHRDTRFDRVRCDDLYAVWIERSVAGELADVVFVVDVDGAARGYLTIRADRGGPAEGGADAGHSSTIGLVAVDPVYRGRGYGDALLRRACEWTAERGLTRTNVVTQGSSAGAVRFYQRAGFMAARVEFWYHRWRLTGADDRS